MDQKPRNGAGSTAKEIGITPTVNHTIIRLLGRNEGEGLGVLDIATATALSINTTKNHVFSLMVAGMVAFDEDGDSTLYKLTESGKKLLEDITS